jgi:drug/metabolite transporter (DMT)-like permease
MPNSDRSRAVALAELHTAVVLFGFAGLFGKWIALTPVLLVLGRTIVAAATLAIIVAMRREERAPFDLRLAASGAVLALHWTAFFAAIQVSNVAIGLLGHASFPLFVLLLERIVGGRRWARRELTTAGLVTTGLVVLVPEFSWADRVVQGLALGLVAGFTFALLAVLNRRWAATRPATNVALWQNAWAALVLLPIAVATTAIPSITPRDAGALLALGVVCTAGAHTLFIASMRSVSAHTASVVAALEPVYGIGLAWLLLGEAPIARTWLGAALIVGAALVATQSAREADSVKSAA